jgi:UDP-N-acetylglucosamine acyltransferase
MAVGQPAEPHSVNSEGLKRRGFNAVQIRNIKNAYRLLYRQGVKLKDALVELEQRATEQPELTPFIEFIKRSSRSIVR